MRKNREIEQTICTRVKEYRLKGKKTQKELAALLEISLSAYQKLEQGQRMFSIPQLYSLCKIYDISMADLLCEPTFDMEQMKNMSEEDVKKIIGVSLRYFGIENYTPKDISALINYLKKYGRTILYTSPLIAAQSLNIYDMQNALLLNTAIEINDWKHSMQSMTIPGVDKDTKERYFYRIHLDELISKNEEFLNAQEEQIAIYEAQIQKMNLQLNDLLTDIEFKIKVRENNETLDTLAMRKKIKDLENEITIYKNRIRDLRHSEEQWKNRISSLAQQYEEVSGKIQFKNRIDNLLNHPNLISKDDYQAIASCIYGELESVNKKLKRELNTAYIEIKTLQEKLDYPLVIENVDGEIPKELKDTLIERLEDDFREKYEELIVKEHQEEIQSDYLDTSHGDIGPEEMDMLFKIILGYCSRCGKIFTSEEDINGYNDEDISLDNVLELCIKGPEDE